MENGTKAFILGGSVFITCAVITLFVLAFRQGKYSYDDMSAESQKSLQSGDTFLQYNQTVVVGSEAIWIAEDSGYPFVFKTSQNPDGFSSLEHVNDKTSAGFVSKAAEFLITIERGGQNYVIVFQQQ